MVALLAWSVLCFCPHAFAQVEKPKAAAYEDRWSEPAYGVRYLRRKTIVPSVIHVLVADLSKPGVRIFATPHEQRWQTVSEFAKKNQLLAAVNGGFWNVMQRAKGMTAGGGERWPTGHDDEETGYFAVTKDGKAWISPPLEINDAPEARRVAEAVSGLPQLVRNGQMDYKSLEEFESSSLRHPRTAVGVSKNGKTVILIVSDGRQSHSRGMTLYELARMFVELGAYAALNLDGGGSSAMYMQSSKGLINSPSGGRWRARFGIGPTAYAIKTPSKARTRVNEEGDEEVFVRGIEREVMNHIGVIASKEAPVHTTTVPLPPPPKDKVRIMKPKQAFALGRARELVYPALYALGALAFVAFIVFSIRRRTREKG